MYYSVHSCYMYYPVQSCDMNYLVQSGEMYYLVPQLKNTSILGPIPIQYTQPKQQFQYNTKTILTVGIVFNTIQAVLFNCVLYSVVTCIIYYLGVTLGWANIYQV